MKIALTRNVFIGLGEVGLKAIVSARNQFRDSFDSIPPIFGFIGLGIEENPPEGLYAGEYFRVRPASDRSQFRSIFMEESTMAIQPILKATMDRVSAATVSEGPDWRFSPDGRVRVHLVFSLSDIVGSGLCIDIAYLIKVLFGEDPLVCMHTVFSGLSEPIGKRHAANAYATLMDLDYLVSHVDASHPYQLVLPYDSFQSIEAPMSSFFLVGTGDQAFEDLGAELYAYALLSDCLSSTQDNMLQCMLDGSLDVEDKKAWITLLRSSSFQFPLAAEIEQKETLLQEAVKKLDISVSLDEKGYNNAPYLVRSIFVAGPEDELIVLHQEPRLNAILSSYHLPILEYCEKPLKKNILLRFDGVFPAFQLAGWDNDLAYKSYDDVRPFHYDTSLLERMVSYHYSIEPQVSIPEEALELWIKGRLLGLLNEDSDLPTSSQASWEIMTQIDKIEAEAPEKTQAAFESVRHLPMEEFLSVFPCPEELADAAYYFCTREL